MKIQIISCDNALRNKFGTDGVIYSTINAPQSFDEFDINIISLQEESVWRNRGFDVQEKIDCLADLESLRCIIQNSVRSKTIVAFPQNTYYKYHYSTNQHKYLYAVELKNIIGVMCGIIDKMIPVNNRSPFMLKYENTTTVINGKECTSAFYFDGLYSGLTTSKGSEKVTTVACPQRMYCTSINLSSNAFCLGDFLQTIGLVGANDELPQWLIDLECLDDAVQNQIVRESSQAITEAQSRIDRAKQQLDANLRYKSVLVTNGDALVDVVFDMLEQLLDCKLTDFIDDKKEDFLVRKDAVTFIGEIKGVTSNVKSEHISQLDVHYHSYLDKLQEQNTTENVKQLLIINPFKTKPLSERDAVHEIQISLAKRNGSLIITTETLLSIYELFAREEISSGRVISVFSQATGLASIEMFK